MQHGPSAWLGLRQPAFLLHLSPLCSQVASLEAPATAAADKMGSEPLAKALWGRSPYTQAAECVGSAVVVMQQRANGMLACGAGVGTGDWEQGEYRAGVVAAMSCI